MIDIEKLPISKIQHIGIVVRDANKAVEFCETLGIGPWKPLKEIRVIERIYKGKPANDIKLEVRFTQWGLIQVEFLQPGGGPSPWQEFLETNGEGLQHVAFSMNDLNELNKEVSELEKKGLQVIYQAKFDNGGGAAYVDARKEIGLVFELFTSPCLQ